MVKNIYFVKLSIQQSIVESISYEIDYENFVFYG